MYFQNTLNKMGLYTAQQYNQMKASIGNIQLPVPLTPQEAKTQRATTISLTIRDKALVEYITRELRDPKYPTEYQQILNKVLLYLKNPTESLEKLW